MPPPPILEIYVLWHPDDIAGAEFGNQLIEHFHTPAYAGLAGGAVEVYLRSSGWEILDGPPRPLPFMSPLPAELPAAQITAVVPVLGRGLAKAYREHPDWKRYLDELFDADAPQAAGPGAPSKSGSLAAGGRVVSVLPLFARGTGISDTGLAAVATRTQALPRTAASSPAVLGREVAQAIAQRIAREFTGSELDERVTVFVSHTKHATLGRDNPERLVATIRDVIEATHLDSFFDAHDIQVTDDWEQRLDQEAGRHALLMVRTDSYARRGWTQREVLIAKRHDLPIVSLYAVRAEEERGSFLMDHVPTVVCPPEDERAAIERALNRLVDEALKRALWTVQASYLEADGFDWRPVHAPEPVTLTHWLTSHAVEREHQFAIMHPDPPLGPKEREVILDLCEIAGLRGSLEILTPRTFATRGGRI